MSYQLYDMFFMQSGFPPYFSLHVRVYLDRVCSGRWIGRGGPVYWPPRSPDLNPLHYFLWRYLKLLRNCNTVYLMLVIMLEINMVIFVQQELPWKNELRVEFKWIEAIFDICCELDLNILLVIRFAIVNTFFLKMVHLYVHLY